MILMVPSVISSSHDSAPKPKAFGGALENSMNSELGNKLVFDPLVTSGDLYMSYYILT